MKTQRINLLAPADHWDAIKIAAARDGLSLSEWVCNAALEKLPKKIVTQLSERNRVGRPSTRFPKNSEKRK